MHKEIQAQDKDSARNLFFKLTTLFRNWNSSQWEGEDFKRYEQEIDTFLES